MADRKKWSHFYYDGLLYKTIAVKRPLDELLAERVSTGQHVFFSYSDVIRNAEPCWTVTEVAKVIGVHPEIIRKGYREGFFPRPEFSKLGANSHRYMLSKKHIADVVQFLAENPRGRQGPTRKVDGKTLGEIMLELEEGLVVYTKTSKGEFVPVWRAEEW